MKKWNKQLVLEEARKYQTRSEWLAHSSKSYYAAKFYGWLPEVSSHMPKRQNKTTPPSDIDVIEESKKYNNIKDWKTDSKYYKYARKRGLVTICSKYMVKINKTQIWNKKTITIEASKYTLPSDWAKKSPRSYSAASKMGLIKDLTKNMDRKWEPRWDRQKIEDSAKKYKNRSSWQYAENSAYNAAIRLGIIEEVTLHMNKSVTTSHPEIKIMELVKNIYPKAHKLKIRSKTEELDFIKGFDIDIYVPELRKGIEFNGDYWHSNAGLKRGRPNWPEDKLKQYHEIKKEFFKKRGIDYIEIIESEWKTDRERCVSKIKEFLKV